MSHAEETEAWKREYGKAQQLTMIKMESGRAVVVVEKEPGLCSPREKVVMGNINMLQTYLARNKKKIQQFRDDWNYICLGTDLLKMKRFYDYRNKINQGVID